MELKLTPERQYVLCKSVRLGSTYLLASQAAGITYTCFYLWMKKGENKVEEIYINFFNAIKKAEADHAEECLENIRKAAAHPQQWTAAAWLLERRYAREYGKEAELILRSERIEAKLDELLGKESLNGKEMDSGSN